MNPPRIVVLAYSDLGYACLRFLLDRHENVVCVYTHQDRPGENVWFPSVIELAREKSVPVRTAETLKEKSEVDSFRSLAPDLAFSFYYRNLIPEPFLEIPRLGAYNMHGSLLPRYRGRAPVNWAVLNGEKEAGATLHVMVEKPDAGDIVDQQAVPIGPDDTAAAVQARVTQAAVDVLARQLENLKSGRAPRTPQDSSRASTFGRRRPEDGRIDWSWPAARVHNLVRAVSHPYPGAFGTLAGDTVFIWETRIRPPVSGGDGRGRPPGSIFVRNDRLFVVCGDGRLLEILRLQREGEAEREGTEFVKHNLITSEENIS